jgi:hypothetical protein
VRLVDIIVRGGHLSEQALIEAVMTGERPAHLERCDICAERAVELGRWLDDVRATGIEPADVAFPPERLAAQQQQILRRLEQLDQPARVITFPSQYKLAREVGGRRVAPGWLAVAAAAGVVLGVVSSQATARLTTPPAAPAAPVAQQQPPAQDPDATLDTTPTTNMAALTNSQALELFDEIERPIPSAFRGMADWTPRVVKTTATTVRMPVKK